MKLHFTFLKNQYIIIIGNEDSIDIVRKEIKNGTFKKPKTFDKVMQDIRNERRFNNSNNVSSERTSKNQQAIRLGNRYGQSGEETRQRQTSNTSLRNQSGGLKVKLLKHHIAICIRKI